jgi:hypothetical protein
MDNTIHFPGPPQPPRPPEPPDDHIITQAPLRLRWGDWRVNRVIQVHVMAAANYEDYREECLAKGQDPSGQMPSHFSLEDSLADTAMALLRHRGDAARLEEVTYLSLLMEALVNTPCPILRTDLIRRVYQEVDALSQRLSLRWRGRAERFVLPLNEDAMHPRALERALAQVDNLRDFFALLRGQAQVRHQALAKGYVLYFPRGFGI